MLDGILFTSTFVLGVCSIASVLSGIAWMRYEQEQELLDARWPTDGLTKERKQVRK